MAACLAGFFDLATFDDKIPSIPGKEDYVLYAEQALCPNYDAELKRYQESPEYKRKTENMTKSFLMTLEQNSGASLKEMSYETLTEVAWLYDNVLNEHSKNLSWV